MRIGHRSQTSPQGRPTLPSEPADCLCSAGDILELPGHVSDRGLQDTRDLARRRLLRSRPRCAACAPIPGIVRLVVSAEHLTVAA